MSTPRNPQARAKVEITAAIIVTMLLSPAVATAASAVLVHRLAAPGTSSFGNWLGATPSLVVFGFRVGLQEETWSYAPATNTLQKLALPAMPMPECVGCGAPPVSLLGSLYDHRRTNYREYKLFRSDGTTSGSNFVSGLPISVSASALLVVGTNLFLQIEKSTYVFELWKVDGVTGTASKLKDLPMYGLRFPVACGGKAYLPIEEGGGSNGQLWWSDGTEAGTARIAQPFALSLGSEGVGWPTCIDGRLYFADALWRPRAIDGVTIGPELANGLLDSPFIGFGNQTYFSMGASGVFRTDGTPAGTALFAAAPPSSQPMFVAGGTLVLQAMGLWGTDGTSVFPLAPNIGLRGRPTSAGNIRYFRAEDAAHGHEIWETDGTAAGTKLTVDLAPGSADAEPTIDSVAANELVEHGGNLYFFGNDGQGNGLFKLNLVSSGVGGTDGGATAASDAGSKGRDGGKRDGGAEGASAGSADDEGDDDGSVASSASSTAPGDAAGCSAAGSTSQGAVGAFGVSLLAWLRRRAKRASIPHGRGR